MTKTFIALKQEPPPSVTVARLSAQVSYVAGVISTVAFVEEVEIDDL